jgi:glycosyltransferase involved in cell wall biosynthesis
VLQYLPWLARHGIRAEARPFMSEALYRMLYLPGHVPQKLLLATGAVMRRLADLVRAARADVVVVHREALPLGTALLERAIARLSPALVFDFDDAIYLNDAHSTNAWTRALRNGAKTNAIIRLSAHVIAGNRVLEAYARSFHQRVSLLPTPVDTDYYRPRPGSEGRARLVIGWIGSPTTASYLAPLQEPLAQLSRRYPRLDIRIVGTTSAPLQLPNLRQMRWDLAQERDELHQCDIGVMPMPDDEWARGKCGFKALLYMSAGIPVVASPVGINTEIVREGINGFLASTPAEWANRLSQLIEDPALRERLGASGRTIVEEEYSLRVSAPRLLRVLKDVGDRLRPNRFLLARTSGTL